MTVTSQKEEPKFASCSITINFNSQKELDAIATLFNTSSIMRGVEKTFNLEGFIFLPIVNEASKIGGNVLKKTNSLAENIAQANG